MVVLLSGHMSAWTCPVYLGATCTPAGSPGPLTALVETGRPIPPDAALPCRGPCQTDPGLCKRKTARAQWYGAVEMPDGQVLLLGALGLESHVAFGWSRADPDWLYEAGQGEWFVGIGEETGIF